MIEHTLNNTTENEICISPNKHGQQDFKLTFITFQKWNQQLISRQQQNKYKSKLCTSPLNYKVLQLIAGAEAAPYSCPISSFNYVVLLCLNNWLFEIGFSAKLLKCVNHILQPCNKLDKKRRKCGQRQGTRALIHFGFYLIDHRPAYE